MICHILSAFQVADPYSPIRTVPLIEFPEMTPRNVHGIELPGTAISLASSM